MAIEPSWRRCTKCQALHIVQPGTTKVCPSSPNQVHTFGSEVYELTHDSTGASGQGGWRKCPQCFDLYFNGSGVCSNGLPHAGHMGGDYVILHGGTSEATGGQTGWRWCQRCYRLFYQSGGGGYCPATGAAHDGSASGHYAVAVHTPTTTLVVTRGSIIISVTVSQWDPNAIAAWGKTWPWEYAHCHLVSSGNSSQNSYLYTVDAVNKPQKITGNGQRLTWNYALPLAWGYGETTWAEIFFCDGTGLTEPAFATRLYVPFTVTAS